MEKFLKNKFFLKTAVFVIVLNFTFGIIPKQTFALDNLRPRSAQHDGGDDDIRRDLLGERIIVHFTEVGKNDIPIAGGKGANLGELQKVEGVDVPRGIAVTTKAFRLHIYEGTVEVGSEGKKLRLPLNEYIEERLEGLDYDNSEALAAAGKDIRSAINAAEMPEEVRKEIIGGYEELSKEAGVKDLPVAVRSSATAEDLPDASFAGQQDTYLNMRGAQQVLDAVKRNWASLFTDRAIFYRHEQGIDHGTAYLSAIIQQMVPSRVAGTAFSVEVGTGFPSTIVDSAWGLGEGVVSGSANPDSHIVKKDRAGRLRILRRDFGAKLQKVVYKEETGLKAEEGTELVDTNYHERHNYCLNDEQVLRIAKAVDAIHNYYGMYMDVEWAFDPEGKLWILQARPETPWNKWLNENQGKVVVKMQNTVVPDADADKAKVLLNGVTGARAAAGRVIIVDSEKEGPELASELSRIKSGDIIVTTMTKPDMVPAMKRAGAIVTDEGGPTCHAAIVARELEEPCIVGTGEATKMLKEGQLVTVDANRGRVYSGEVNIVELRDNIDPASLPVTKTKIGVIIASPFLAMKMWGLSLFESHYGVGLLRKEFADTTEILLHPLAGLAYDMYNDPNFKDEKQKQWIKENIIDNEELLTVIEETIMGYASFAEFYKDKLANAIALIAAAQVNGQRVKFRTTDFKTNEYKEQIGGPLFEPSERNPMMGNRGIYRMLSDVYRVAFELEIEAIKKARESQKNIDVMFPVVRTVEELREAIDLFAEHGLVRGEDEFQIGMMVEVPANIFQAGEFFEIVDFMSIGSNDMTQFTLGIGRDNDKMRSLFDETNPAVERGLEIVIKTAKQAGVTSGLCGHRPSYDSNFAASLVKWGIDSLSVVPEAYSDVVGVVARQEADMRGEEFNPEVSGWSIPVKEGIPDVVLGEPINAGRIIQEINVHPIVLMNYDKGEVSGGLKSQVEAILKGNTAKQYVVDMVYSAVMQMAEKTPADIPLVYSTDDLDKSEYEVMIGGEVVEGFDENPQLGFTGLARVVDDDYEEFLRWQLEGIRKARQDSKRENIYIRLNLARTLPEVTKALDIIRSEEDQVKVGMEMAVPSNVLLAKEFIDEGIDFFSANEQRFVTYNLALDPDSPYINISDENKTKSLENPRKIWTKTAQENAVPMVQSVEELEVAAEEYFDFLKADNNLYNMYSGDFQEFLRVVEKSYASAQAPVMRAIVVSPNFIKQPGARYALEVLKKTSSAFKIGIYGEGVDFNKYNMILGGGVITGRNIADVLSSIAEENIESENTLFLGAPEDKAEFLANNRRFQQQKVKGIIVAKEFVPLAIAKAVRELLGTLAASDAFADLLKKMVYTDRIIQEASYNQNAQNILDDLQEGTVFDFTDLAMESAVVVTETIQNDIETYEEFWTKV